MDKETILVIATGLVTTGIIACVAALFIIPFVLMRQGNVEGARTAAIVTWSLILGIVISAIVTKKKGEQK